MMCGYGWMLKYFNTIKNKQYYFTYNDLNNNNRKQSFFNYDGSVTLSAVPQRQLRVQVRIENNYLFYDSECSC